DGAIGVVDGVLLLVIFLGHLVASVWIARRDPGDELDPPVGHGRRRGCGATGRQRPAHLGRRAARPRWGGPAGGRGRPARLGGDRRRDRTGGQRPRRRPH